MHVCLLQVDVLNAVFVCALCEDSGYKSKPFCPQTEKRTPPVLYVLGHET